MTERLTDEALLPCPFCGGSRVEDVMRTGAIVCTDCDASARNKRLWNRRATPADDLRAENERLKTDLAVAEAAKAAHKSRGDNHWETMRCIYRIATVEGDMQAVIQHIKDAGYGYTERPDETLRRYQTELAAALDELAAARAALSQNGGAA